MYGCDIIAHRGANKRAPQNTLPAFQKALDMNTDGFETDVHLTKDGVPVICHNKTIDATSNGTGAIEDMTLEQLKSYDFGSYMGLEFKGTTLPTLEEFLQLAQGKNLKILNIELKQEPDAARREKLVRTTLEMVEKYGLSDILLISTFSTKILALIQEISPKTKTAYLYPQGYWQGYKVAYLPIRLLKKLGCYAVHPHKICVRKGYVEAMHKAGIKVNVWTIDESNDIKAMLEAGVDGIITDCPDRVRALINALNGYPEK